MGYINVRFDEQSVPSKLLEDTALLIQALGSAFSTLNRIRFQAPWIDDRDHSY